MDWKELGDLMQGVRQNLLISGLACLSIGAVFTLGLDPSLAPFGATIGLAGIVLFIWGHSTKPDEHGLSQEEIATWQPSGGQMPDSGRVMYRIDTTLDEPITTTILCGACGDVAKVEGRKPNSWDCPSCDVFLWHDEEE